MICPACHKLAKNSYGYPGVFVCDCSGVLEDIEILRNKNKLFINIQKPNFFIKQIHGKGTLLENFIDLANFENFWGTIFPENGFFSRIRTSLAATYRSDMKIFHCHNNGNNLIIFINNANLIPDGRYIFNDLRTKFQKNVKEDFKVIKEELIKQKQLSSSLFESNDLYTKYYNKPWLNT